MQVKSEAKSIAARENGKKGGRPKVDKCACGKPGQFIDGVGEVICAVCREHHPVEATDTTNNHYRFPHCSCGYETPLCPDYPPANSFVR
jgi:hypothetical protein